MIGVVTGRVTNLQQDGIHATVIFLPVVLFVSSVMAALSLRSALLFIRRLATAILNPHVKARVDAIYV